MKTESRKHKGQLNQIPNIVNIMLIVGITLGVTYLVLANFATVSLNATGSPTNATNAINSTVAALDNFVALLPVIVIIAAAAIVLSLVGAFNR